MYQSKKEQLIGRLRFTVKRAFGKSVQVQLPSQLFKGTFARRNFVSKREEASPVFYHEAARHILTAAMTSAPDMESGEVISVIAADLAQVPDEIRTNLGFVINDHVDCTHLIYSGERGRDTFVFTKV